MKKIKNFKCNNTTIEDLKAKEKEINDFTSTHNVLDIKVTSCCNSFGWLILYVIIYEED